MHPRSTSKGFERTCSVFLSLDWWHYLYQSNHLHWIEFELYPRRSHGASDVSSKLMLNSWCWSFGCSQIRNIGFLCCRLSHIVWSTPKPLMWASSFWFPKTVRFVVDWCESHWHSKVAGKMHLECWGRKFHSFWDLEVEWMVSLLMFRIRIAQRLVSVEALLNCVLLSMDICLRAVGVFHQKYQ